MLITQIAALLHGNVAVQRCRMCNHGNLRRVLDLGHQPHSDDFLSPERLNEAEVSYPLRLVQCAECGLLQIDYLVSPSILYGLNYAYQTSANIGGVAHYHEMARHVAEKSGVGANSFAIDIGSNVGVVLEGFQRGGHRILGIEPAGEIVRIARENGIPTLSKFFSALVAKDVRRDYGQADVITMTNVFAHLHDLDDAVQGIKILLKDSGVLVIEAPSALELVRGLEYDTIYHQHVTYLSVKPMKKFCDQHGLELFDVERVAIHGGSNRYFVGWSQRHVVTAAVAQHIQSEEEFGLYSKARLDHFAIDVAAHRVALQQLLGDLKKKGKRIAALSAPAKGNTLLNYCHFDTSVISFASEKNTMKIGTLMPGTHIPIVSDEAFEKNPPDFALLLAWNFADALIAKHEAFRRAGGSSSSRYRGRSLSKGVQFVINAAYTIGCYK